MSQNNSTTAVNLSALQKELVRIRGNTVPDASVIIPVNARGDLENVLQLVAQLATYSGKYTFEVVLIINNYPPDAPPAEIETYANHGMKVVSAPDLRRPGFVPAMTARAAGLREAESENCILLDADCKVPNPTALIDWYIEAFANGAKVVYAHVEYFGHDDKLVIHARIWAHHISRWIKRVLMGIPTTRGSSYGANRTMMLDLLDRGMIADEMNVGPAIKHVGGKVAYSGAKAHVVYTSGRMFNAEASKGWGHLFRYLRNRLFYNARVLPVREDVASRTGVSSEKTRQYVNNKPVDE